MRLVIIPMSRLRILIILVLMPAELPCVVMPIAHLEEVFILLSFPPLVFIFFPVITAPRAVMLPRTMSVSGVLIVVAPAVSIKKSYFPTLSI